MHAYPSSMLSTRRHLAVPALVLAQLLVLTLLGGCGGGDSVSTTTADKPLLVATAAESAGAQCVAGGVNISSGLDSNGDGILSSREVSAVQYVCSGSAANAGISSLVSTSSLASGNSHCLYGGSQIDVGPDSSANGVLDTAEISSTAYVCQTAAGTSGTAGAGRIISLVPFGASLACPYGGYTVNSGIADASGNISGVPSTAVLCNGATGTTLLWVDVTASSQQAASNTGYLANNPEGVTITLPNAPSLGDVVRVSSVAGSWTIAQNAGQRIKTQGLPFSNGYVLNQKSTLISGAASVAISASGRYLAAGADDGGNFHTSTDGGNTWTSIAGGPTIFNLAISDDGSLVAGISRNSVYTSNDLGAHWTQQTVPGAAHSWSSVASSANGQFLVLSPLTTTGSTLVGGQFYASYDAGLNWVVLPNSPWKQWRKVVVSADGTHMAAIVFTSPIGGASDYIYTSADSGVTWTEQTNAGAHNWADIASSADGTRLVAAVGVSESGAIYTSDDAAEHWIARTAVDQQRWSTIAISADGSSLAAAGNRISSVYTSVDSGASWSTHTELQQTGWSKVALSKDGLHLAAAATLGTLVLFNYATVPSETTLGEAGSLSGSLHDAVELQYLGDGVFSVLNFSSYSGSFTAN